MRPFLSILALTVVSACTAATGATTSTSSAAVVDTTTTGTSIPTSLGCPQNADFSDSGQVMRVDQPESDTATIGLITWSSAEGCETFQIDFETAEGAPATTPPSVTVEYLDSLQVVRISVEATATVITDQLVQTDIVERLFVVRALDGGMFIDLHLRAPGQARARISNSPARLFVELQRGLGEFNGQTAVSARMVLTEPWEGATVATNLEVSGYSRTIADTVKIIATNGNEVVTETTTPTAESSDTWGEFELRIDVPTGDTSLFVGDQESDDGALAGVTVNISTG